MSKYCIKMNGQYFVDFRMIGSRKKGVTITGAFSPDRHQAVFFTDKRQARAIARIYYPFARVIRIRIKNG